MFQFGLETFEDFYTMFGGYDADEAVTFLFKLDHFNTYHRDLVRLMCIGAALDHQQASGSEPNPATIWNSLHEFAVNLASSKKKQFATAYNNMIQDPITWKHADSYTGPTSNNILSIND